MTDKTHPWRRWKDPDEQENANPPDVFITILKSEVTALIDENKSLLEVNKELKEKLAKFGHK